MGERHGKEKVRRSEHEDGIVEDMRESLGISDITQNNLIQIAIGCRMLFNRVLEVDTCGLTYLLAFNQ